MKNIILSIFSIFIVAFSSISHANARFSHDLWQQVLEQYVNTQGYVDYDALLANRAKLDEYLTLIKTQGPTSTPDLFPTKDDELAYYINAYNALVFEGVINRGPEKKSVWRGLISGLNFFRLMDVTFDKTESNLQSLEDDLIRAKFNDPRIHAAINCASISCPRLPQTAFTAEQLQQQLDAAMTEFINTSHHVTINAERKVVQISKIFDWFEEDFIAYEKAQGNSDPRITDYLNRFLPLTKKIDSTYKVEYFDYNKGINSQENQPAS